MFVGTPFPGTFIVDRQGRVIARFFEEFYRDRYTTSNIMLRLGVDMNASAAMEASTGHLAIKAYQSNSEVVAGSRFSVKFDVTPAPGLHVYAPGAEKRGYRVIGVTFAPNRHVRFLPLEYPASEIYHFEPLDERVPVYHKPFTLVQELVVGASREDEKALRGVEVITVTGRLDYQACDDAVCFNPVSVPLSWTLKVVALDRQPGQFREIQNR